jgi:glycosyltransferase involved in cell wall biosynthesis
MKVSCIANSWIPSMYANSIQVMKMCQAIAELGHEVTLFIGTNEKEEIQLKGSDVFNFYGIERAFEIKRIPLKTNSIHALLSSIYAKLKRAELCYTRSIYAASLIPRLGILTIFESDSPIHWRLDKQIAPLLLNSLNLKILSISNSLTKIYIEKYKINPKKILTKPNGVDLERFTALPTKEQLREELNLPQDTRIICYAGNLYKGRGIELLLLVSKKLLQDSLVLIVGGRPRDLERYKSISLEMHCTNLHFTGFVPYNTIPKYLSASDVLVMPYERDAEDPGGRIQANYMCPMKMFEYMASGRPIVASSLDQIKEILRDGENAILCDPADVGGILKSIEIALDNKELAQKIARNAQDEVKKYTWAERAKETLSFLTE